MTVIRRCPGPRTWSRPWKLLSGAGLLAWVVAAGCGGPTETNTAKVDKTLKSIVVDVAPVEHRTVERTVEVVGTLKGWEEVRVGAKKGGRVLRVYRDMGDHVAPGEKLVELDKSDARLALAQAKSRFLADLARLGITEHQALLVVAQSRLRNINDLISKQGNTQLADELAIAQALIPYAEKLVEVEAAEKAEDVDPVTRSGLNEQASEARSRYLALLASMGYTEQRAEDVLKPYGIGEELISGKKVTEIIRRTPPIVQATAAVKKAQQNLQRQQQLKLRGFAKTEDLQNVENEFETAQAARDTAITTARNYIATAITAKVAIDVAEETLKDMVIQAPNPTTLPAAMDKSKLTYGVAKRSVAEGQILRDGDAVYDLVIENPLRLWTTVPERFAAEVKEGQEVRVRVSTYPKEVFLGKVTRVNPAVDPLSRTFQVESLVQNDDGRLHPGGFAKVAIILRSESDALTVPIESVVRFAGVTKIFLAVDGHAQSVEVTTGVEEVTSEAQQGRPGWIEVIGAIPEGTQVVTSGQTKLADGTPLEVRAPTAAKP